MKGVGACYEPAVSHFRMLLSMHLSTKGELFQNAQFINIREGYKPITHRSYILWRVSVNCCLTQTSNLKSYFFTFCRVQTVQDMYSSCPHMHGMMPKVLEQLDGGVIVEYHEMDIPGLTLIGSARKEDSTA